MKNIFAKLIILSIFLGLASISKGQEVVRPDSMDARMRSMLEDFFRQLKKDLPSRRKNEINKKVKSINRSGIQYTIPIASENNTIKLTIVNTTNGNIKDLSVNTEGVPSWLQVETTHQNLGELSAGDMIEFSFKFDLPAEIPANKKAEITFIVRGGNGILARKIIEIVTDERLDFGLSHNYPNPFTNSTKMNMVLPAPMYVTIEVYDVLGRKVETLMRDVRQSAGAHIIGWDATGMASGVYFCRVRAKNKATGEEIIEIVKMMLIK